MIAIASSRKVKSAELEKSFVCWISKFKMIFPRDEA